MPFTFAPLNESSDRPAYKQIADLLREAVISGEIAAGSLLPSEKELMDGFKVARGTARQAFAILKAEGLIDTSRGRGATVRERPPIRRVAHERFGQDRKSGAFVADVEDMGRTPHVEMIELGKTTPPESIAKALKLRKSDAALIRRRRYLADDIPMQIASTYVPWRIAKGTQMIEENTGPGGLYGRLADAGHKVKRYVEEVHARPAVSDENDSLQLPQGMPVLVVHRVGMDENDEPVEFSEIVMAADRYVLMYETALDG
jgi:GntR family transcriptional regulator